MSDEKKRTLTNGNRVTQTALLVVLLVYEAASWKPIQSLSKLPILIETMEAHSKQIDDIRKGIEEIREVLKRNKIASTEASVEITTAVYAH